MVKKIIKRFFRERGLVCSVEQKERQYAICFNESEYSTISVDMSIKKFFEELEKIAKEKGGKQKLLLCISRNNREKRLFDLDIKSKDGQNVLYSGFEYEKIMQALDSWIKE